MTGNVADPHRIAQRAANARVVEQGFDDDDAGREVGDVERDDLEHRAERVGQCVSPQHDLLRRAFQSGHLDIVALQDLDHRSPHHA